ncbi:uncharacterized protein ACR2FA_012257 [Aphomia sociella]
MEHSREVLEIQGVFLSADNIYSLSSLTSKGGNDDKIEFITNSVRKFLEEHNYITEIGTIVESSVEKLRSIIFFIILNSDLPSLEDITDIDELDMYIWVLPTLSKCLMCEMLWNLNFDKFIQELMSYCNPQLSLEIADAFTENLKYCTPFSCLSKVKLISASIHKIICRMHFFELEENVLTEKLTMAYNIFEKCTYYFNNPPKPEDIIDLNKDEFFKFCGQCFQTILLLILDCLEQYVEIPELYPNDVGKIYTITHLRGTSTNIVNYKVCHSPNTSILDCVKKCHISLLNKLQEHGTHVSVTIFCAWSEINIGSKTMQQIIGELSYKVRNKLMNITCLSDHPVISMLQQIARKPSHWKDLIDLPDSEALVESINTNEEDKAECLRALMEKDYLLRDDTLIQCFASNIECLNENECYELLKSIITYMNSEPNNKAMLEKLAVKSFHHCNVTAKQEILTEYFSNKMFVNMTDNLVFALMLKEIFNKLILSPKTNMTDVLTIFFQNPKLVYNEIFKLAAENIQQTYIMLETMKLLQKYSNHYYDTDTQPCIVVVIQECFETYDRPKLENLLKFVCGLKKNNCITGAKLLLLIIMPKLHKALLNKDLECLYNQTKLLQEAYSLDELLEYRAPMLAMLAQMLGIVRWNMVTFEPFSPKTLQIILQLQISLFNTYYASGIPEKESRWLKSKLKSMHPMNMYYYRKLWNPPGKNFLEIIRGQPISLDMNKERLATWLSNLLCRSNQQEWCDAWDSLAVFSDKEKLELFHNALSLLTIVEDANTTPVSWHCMLYSYRNFVNIIRYKFLKGPLNDVNVKAVIDNIALTINLTEENHVEALGTIFLPLFSYMAEKRNDYTINVVGYMNNKLRHAQFANMIQNVFSNSAQ